MGHSIMKTPKDGSFGWCAVGLLGGTAKPCHPNSRSNVTVWVLPHDATDRNGCVVKNRTLPESEVLKSPPAKWSSVLAYLRAVEITNLDHVANHWLPAM